jgi:hypothetical protein
VKISAVATTRRLREEAPLVQCEREDMKRGDVLGRSVNVGVVEESLVHDGVVCATEASELGQAAEGGGGEPYPCACSRRCHELGSGRRE